MESSIEWLIKQIWNRIPPNEDEQKVIDQAKQKEKENIMGAWHDGRYFYSNWEDDEDYFNETFKPE